MARSSSCCSYDPVLRLIRTQKATLVANEVTHEYVVLGSNDAHSFYPLNVTPMC